MSKETTNKCPDTPPMDVVKSRPSSNTDKSILLNKELREQTKTIFLELGFAMSVDGRITFKQFPNYPVERVITDITNHILEYPENKRWVSEIQLERHIAEMVNSQRRKSDELLFDKLKFNGTVINQNEQRDFLRLYFQWNTDEEYKRIFEIFNHVLLNIKRQFYGIKSNNPLCLILHGEPGDGKSVLLNDLSNILTDSFSLEVKDFNELFKDNRGFQVWGEKFLISIHEFGMIPQKLVEVFKDCIDSKNSSGRYMGTNAHIQNVKVSTLIGATNKEPEEVLQYDPNNRKVVFLPFIRLTPANRQTILEKRDQFREMNFLQRWFISLDETSSDCFDDPNYYSLFINWLKIQNAEHSVVEKYIDYLIFTYGGKTIKAGSLHEVYSEHFHPLFPSHDNEGNAYRPLNLNNFRKKFSHLFREERDTAGRYRVIPTPEQAIALGFNYVDPSTQHYFDTAHCECIKKNIEVFDSFISESEGE